MASQGSSVSDTPTAWGDLVASSVEGKVGPGVPQQLEDFGNCLSFPAEQTIPKLSLMIGWLGLCCPFAPSGAA